MASGRLGDNLGVKEDLIKKACAKAFEAHCSPKKHYVPYKFRSSSETILIISFPGSWVAHDWLSGYSFGETKISLALFPSLRSFGNDEPALVNEAFLRRFESMLSNSSLKSKVNKATTKGKRIVFTGHSAGAPIAILATLWTLEEYLSPKKNENQNYIPPLCVTFGSPFVGNHIFSHVTRRENWSSYFVHFVMRYDIVPRILLAPLSSFNQRFEPILQFFNPNSKSFKGESIGRATVTSDFYLAVMTNAATVTSHAACKLMGSTNELLETGASFIALSPYRPFGTYIFCTGNGKLIVIRNPDAVLQLLFFSAQLTTEAEAAEVANRSLREHLIYGSELQTSLGVQNVVSLDKLEELALSSDGSNEDITTINEALNDLGLGTRARSCLRAAGELEKLKSSNEAKMEKEIKEKALKSMEEIEEYRAMCETQKVCYYDAFKRHEHRKDFKANVNRLVLASVWDEIIEMLKRYELPDEFEANPEWIERSTEFRRLVEPLDIANYYRHHRNTQPGSAEPYMGDRGRVGRPKRYIYIQRWQQHAEGMQQRALSESSFWAEVEELCRETDNNKPFEDVKEKIVQLEQDIKTWTDDGALSKDVFIEGSTFVNWWKSLPSQHKEGSCIKSLIN